MESEKVKKIKKALECCATDLLIYDCPKCPYADNPKCKDVLLSNVLTYINELENENIELKQDLKKALDMQGELLEQFKQELAKVEETFAKEIPNLLKQFAERLKEKMSEGEYLGQKYKLTVFRDIDIDETLNEFLKGENNE